MKARQLCLPTTTATHCQTTVHGSTLLDDDDTALKKTVDDTYKHIEVARVQVEQAQGGKSQRNLNRAGNAISPHMINVTESSR